WAAAAWCRRSPRYRSRRGRGRSSSGHARPEPRSAPPPAPERPATPSLLPYSEHASFAHPNYAGRSHGRSGRTDEAQPRRLHATAPAVALVHRQRALDVGVQELADELVARVEELVRGAGLDDPPLP